MGPLRFQPLGFHGLASLRNQLLSGLLEHLANSRFQSFQSHAFLR